MECTTPPALTDEALSAILDGEFDASIEQHLSQCPACAARLAEMRQMDMLFHSLRRIECPSPQIIGDFHLGFLDDAHAALVRQHLEACPRCQDELATLIEFLELPTEEPIINPIIPLWDTGSTYKATRVDTSGNLALLRGKDDKSAHDVQAGSARIFLETSPTPKGYLLSGQVVDSEVGWGSGVVEFWQDKALQQIGVLDEMSEFHFEFTTAVPISLYITAPSGITLAIEDILIQT
jgi:hypothetical protein